MSTKLLDAWTRYTSANSLWKMLGHVILLMMAVATIGGFGILWTNFDRIAQIYDRNVASNDIKVDAELIRSEQINAILMTRRQQLSVDRLYVSKFHNGKVDINGVHFIYFSRISEQDGPGVGNELLQSQALPLSIFPDMVTALTNNTCYYEEVVNSKVDNSVYLNAMGVISVAICPIRTPTGQLVGIIGAEGVITPIDAASSVGLQEKMRDLSQVLGVLITNNPA